MTKYKVMYAAISKSQDQDGNRDFRLFDTEEECRKATGQEPVEVQVSLEEPTPMPRKIRVV